MRFLQRWWPLLVLVVAVLAGVAYLNHLRGRASSAEEELGRARIEAAGGNAVHEVRVAELRAEQARMVRESAVLEAELERLRGALPGARPVATASGSTGARPVQAPASPSSVPCPAVPGAPPAPMCLLTSSDLVELRIHGVALVGDSGAIGVAAVAQAWRLGPEPALLVEGPLKLDVQMKDPGELPGWGVGLLTTGGREGWAVGPVVSPPPTRLWGLEGSLLVGVALGPGGTWTAAGLGLLRW